MAIDRSLVLNNCSALNVPHMLQETMLFWFWLRFFWIIQCYLMLIHILSIKNKD
jgi:hypothetical protein